MTKRHRRKYEKDPFVLARTIALTAPFNEYEQRQVKPIRDWMNANGFQGENWIRFDCEGDTLDGVPVYEWEAV